MSVSEIFLTMMIPPEKGKAEEKLLQGNLVRLVRSYDRDNRANSASSISKSALSKKVHKIMLSEFLHMA